MKEEAEGGLLTFTVLARATVLKVDRCASAPVLHRKIDGGAPLPGDH